MAKSDGPQRRAGAALSRPARAWLWMGLKWAVGIGILLWLYRLSADDLVRLVQSPKDWRYALAGFAVIAASNVIMFGRWWLLVRAQQFPFRFHDAVRYGFAGLATNFVIPGTVGGDLFKALLLASDQASRRAAAAATVVVDRLLGLVGLLILGMLATLLPHDFPDSPAVQANTTLLWAGSLTGLTLVGLLLALGGGAWNRLRGLARLPLIGPVAHHLIEALILYQSRRWAVLAALGLSLVNNSGMIVGLYFCAKAMQPAWLPTLAAHFYFRPTAELFGALSMLPGGFGALEFAIREAYVLLNPGAVADHEAAAAGLAAALAFRVTSISVAALGLCYYLYSAHRHAGSS